MLLETIRVAAERFRPEQFEFDAPRRRQVEERLKAGLVVFGCPDATGMRSLWMALEFAEDHGNVRLALIQFGWVVELKGCL